MTEKQKISITMEELNFISQTFVNLNKLTYSERLLIKDFCDELFSNDIFLEEQKKED